MAFTEELLLSAMDEVGEAIVIYDENDNFLHCNEANRKLYPHLAHLYKQLFLLCCKAKITVKFPVSSV